MIALRNLLAGVEEKISRRGQTDAHVRCLDLLAGAAVWAWDMRSERDHVRARAVRRFVRAVRRVFLLTDNLPMIDTEIAKLAGAVISLLCKH